ncbi:hypothetical protein C9J41_07665 [Photobacterium sp. GB-50]|nr:hypothetical protein C9J41_07665 [Photobacterium sp. GB-50]
MFLNFLRVISVFFCRKNGSDTAKLDLAINVLVRCMKQRIMHLGLLLLTMVVSVNARADSDHLLLPQDPSWITGKLVTGFTYHILPVDEQSDRIQLYLRVKAGSVQETDQQKGYAHLLEHMAFNGTKHFPKNEIIRLFEQAGLEFGRDLNAFTSFENTVYQLSIPEGNEQLLKKVLQYLADISYQINLEQDEIAKEIGVVQGEIYSRANLIDNPYIAYMENFGEGTKYQYQKITGTVNSIKKATHKGLKAYYDSWYHPTNMELLIVGNVKEKTTVKFIKEQFSDFKGYRQLELKQPPHLPTFKQTPFTVFSSQIKEETSSLVFNLSDYQYKTYQDDYHNRLVNFLNQLINHRLTRSNELLKTPYKYAYSYLGTPNDAGNKWVYSLGVGHDNFYKNRSGAIKFLASEVARLHQYGFTNEEFELQKNLLSAQIIKSNVDYKNQKSVDIINRALDSLIHNKVNVSPSLDNTLAKKFLAEIRLDEINNFTYEVLVNPQFSAFYTKGAGAPDTDKIIADIQQILLTKQSLPNGSLVTESKALIVNLPSLGKIVKSSDHPKYNMQELHLDNGVAVLLQPDASADGKVYLEFSAPGGITILDPKYRAAAVALTDIYFNSGLSGMTNQQTTQLFQLNNTQLIPYISNTTQGFTIETVADNLDFAMSSIYAAMLNGEIDDTVFHHVKQSMIQWTRNNDPNFESVTKGDLFSHNPYEGKLSLKQLYDLDKDKVKTVYKWLFGHANGYKLTVIGDFEPLKAKALIEKYIGSLPEGKKHQYTTKKQPVLNKKVSLKRGINKLDRADLVFNFIFEATEPNIKDIYASDLISRILQRKMLTYVREELSLTYSPNAWCGSATPGSNYARCQINVVTDKKDAKKGIEAVEYALADLYKTGVPQFELDEHKKALVLAMLDNDKLPKDRAWFVHRDFINGFPIGAVLEPQTVVDEIDKAYIDSLINHYLKNAGQVTLTVLP